MIFWTLYILLCVIAGWLGKESRLGLWGVALIGFLLTPVVALLLVMLFGRRSDSRRSYS